MSRLCSRFLLMMALGVSPLVASADVHGAVRVRLFGIDAPEMSQTCATPHGDWDCGHWSRDMLQALADGPVTCTDQGTDRYGRVVGQCDAGHGDLGAAMVDAGAATAYRRYSSVYVPQETAARADSRGIWRQSSRGAVDPAAYRAARRGRSEAQSRFSTAQALASPGACVIKGNISANGRIFHVPGQRDYDRTRIDPNRGERWFCSAQEALAAGWRAAAR